MPQKTETLLTLEIEGEDVHNRFYAYSYSLTVTMYLISISIKSTDAMLDDPTQNSMELVVSQPLKKFRAWLETRMYIAVFTMWPFAAFCFNSESITPRTSLKQEELPSSAVKDCSLGNLNRCYPNLETTCTILSLRTHHIVVAGDPFNADAARTHKKYEFIHESRLLWKQRKRIILRKTLWSSLFKFMKFRSERTNA